MNDQELLAMALAELERLQDIVGPEDYDSIQRILELAKKDDK